MKEAYDTGGRSIVKGVAAFADDLLRNGGRPKQVDRSGFKVGENLAATPGRVVFRNDLMELIAYEPQTAKVHAQPILCSPPWINKYYIMDLAPRPLVRGIRGAARLHGIHDQLSQPRCVDARSGMDDYLQDGLLAALDQVHGDHRCGEGESGRAVPGWAARHAGDDLLTATGQADRLGWVTLTEHHDRLQRAGCLGDVHRRERDPPARGAR